MKLTVDRETLLGPLSAISGVVEKRQTMPVLSHFLLQVNDSFVTLTASDLEVELKTKCLVAVEEQGEITVPARKLLDIFKTLPENSQVKLTSDDSKLIVNSGRSRFSLATLPASDFPLVDSIGTEDKITVPQVVLKKLLDRTYFSMAQQDVRYYLNGLLFELRSNELRAVGTDGHRLAAAVEKLEIDHGQLKQVIIPRKGVNELQRLLTDTDDGVEIELGANHIRVTEGDIQFTSKLIDGRFPDYTKVIPQEGGPTLTADRAEVRQAIVRASILSNEKYRGLRIGLSNGLLSIQAHNPDQEEASEEVVVDYNGPDIEVGFNATYLLDALGALTTEKFTLQIKDANSSGLIRGEGGDDARYVVMPMRL